MAGSDGKMKLLWDITQQALPAAILDLLSNLHWNPILAEDDRRARHEKNRKTKSGDDVFSQ